jgi:uncharacterized protein YggE
MAIFKVQHHMKHTTLLLLPIVVVTLATTVFAQQARESTPPVLIVSGNAQAEATPDEATVRLGFVRQETTAQAAQDQANRVAQSILSEIAKLGIPAAQIRTSRLTLSPIYAPSPRSDSRDAPRIASYSASNQVSVELTNLTQIGPVIDAGLRAGANQVDGVLFRLKDDLPVREQALKKAVAEARRKAEVMAEALNVRLLGVQEVSESGSSVMPRGESGGFAMAAAREVAPTPVSPGQIEVSVSVMVKYLISGR